jgi:hypothetical protein
MKTELKTYRDLYDHVRGGIKKIAYDLNLLERSVERWERYGHLEKYDEKLCELYGVTKIELRKMRTRAEKFAMRRAA